MRLLFLFQTFSFKKSTIYLDLINEAAERGHKVTVVAGSTEKDLPDGKHKEGEIDVVYLKLPDQFGAGKIKKGLIQVAIPFLMKALIKDELWDDKFDLIVYPTPPVTLAPVVEKCRKHFKCITYLMLKDIFPQNAVDLEMMGEGGITYRYFKGIEKRLYAASDIIGCMSEANVRYLLSKEPWIDPKKVEYFPNTVKVKALPEKKDGVSDEISFFFGGNMGKPQGIDFLLEGIARAEKTDELKGMRFSFIGDGSESGVIEEFIKTRNLKNLTYEHSLLRDEYEERLKNADIGIVSLSDRFTIPNYPSRVLSYMQTATPVLAVTDKNTDIKELITEEAGCGFWTRSGDIDGFTDTLKEIASKKDELKDMGMRGRKYLERYFNVSVSVDILERAYRG